MGRSVGLGYRTNSYSDGGKGRSDGVCGQRRRRVGRGGRSKTGGERNGDWGWTDGSKREKRERGSEVSGRRQRGFSTNALLAHTTTFGEQGASECERGFGAGDKKSNGLGKVGGVCVCVGDEAKRAAREREREREGRQAGERVGEEA